MREHGTNAKYVLEKCRCVECKAAHVEYERGYWRRRRANGGRPLMVDAEPVRRHLRAIMAGNRKGGRLDSVGPKSMAKASGVPHGAISKLLYGDYSRGSPPSRRVRRETAEKLMALTKESAMSDGAAVPNGETMRLIRSLVEFGIPKARIQDAIDAARGRGPSPLRALQLSYRDTRWIRKSTKEAIYRLHWRLWLTNPEFRWGCEIEPPAQIVGIRDNARGLPTSSYTEGWRYATKRGAMVEATGIAGRDAKSVVTLAADGTYRWYPSPEYAPPGERVVARRVASRGSGGEWRHEAPAEAEARKEAS